MKGWKGVDGSGLVVIQDIATAGCALLNGAYFSGYWWQRNGPHGRRVGALALVLISAAAFAGAAFSQGLFWSGTPDLAPGLWAIARTPLFVSTVFVSALVVRRMRAA